MIRAVADTHAVIWYLFNDPRLSTTARAVIEEAAAAGDVIAFSSITLAEIVYLAERGRIHAETLLRLSQAMDAEDAVLVETPFDRNIAQAMTGVPRQEVPDLPDRIIAATALYLNVPIISRDGLIRASRLKTIW
jgi:PIN domain nuclease of toxin-antitoxin system